MRHAIDIIRQLVREWGAFCKERKRYDDVDEFSERRIAPTRESLLVMVNIYVPIPVLEWGPLYKQGSLRWYIAMPGRGKETHERAYFHMTTLGDVRFDSAETALHVAAALNQGHRAVENPPTSMYPDDMDNEEI